MRNINKRFMEKYKPKYARKTGTDILTRFCRYKMLFVVFMIAAIFYISFGIAVVSGTSMAPALYPGDVILFWKLSSTYERDEIILIKTDGREDYVKRIIGLPGETIEIRSGTMMIDGDIRHETHIFEETYPKPQVSYPLELSVHEYFVMGDHRSDSRDSRNYGPIDSTQIDGKVLIIFRRGGINA